jgi:hypothetical protein
MRLFGIFAVILALVACASTGPAQVADSRAEGAAPNEGLSVTSLTANFRQYLDVPIRLTAYLISTDHGAYLVDDPDGHEVLAAKFSKSESDRESVSKLGAKMLKSHIGHPYGQIHGTFEGHLVLEDGTRVPSFEISSQLQ